MYDDAYGMERAAVKVLHLITALETGGAETMLHKLLSGMDRTAFESRVVSLVDPGEMGERIAALNVPVGGLGMRRGAPGPGGLLRLARLLRGWRPDVVQTWLYHADLLGVLATRLARIGTVAWTPRVAWNIRCSYMDFSRYRRTTRWTVAVCARLSGLPDAVLTNSEEARRFHLGLGYHPRRFEVIPNGFDTERFRPDPLARAAVRAELGVADAAPLAGLFGRLDPMKGVDDFVRAARLVARDLSGARFVLAGKGMEPENPALRSLLDGAGLRERFVPLGQRSDPERVMAALDVYVSASLGEGFPNVLGEAMACGVPCVTTDAGDSAAVVGETGRIVPCGDPEALARELGALLRLPEAARASLSASARERIRTGYALDRIIARYCDFYRGLVPGGDGFRCGHGG